MVLYAVDLEAAQATIEGNGGKVVREIQGFPGGRRFHFEDPQGNQLAVWSDRDADGAKVEVGRPGV